jgi:hypothetical protein
METDFVVCSEREPLIFRARFGLQKTLSVWAHLATTSHGERTCRPNFPFETFLTDFDVNPFFTSKSGECGKMENWAGKFIIWDVTFFSEGGALLAKSLSYVFHIFI